MKLKYTEQPWFELLSNLVRTNSHTLNAPGVNKCGRMLIDYIDRACREGLLPYLEWETYKSNRKTENGKVFGHLISGKSSNWKVAKYKIVLSGHLDTVFPFNEDKSEESVSLDEYGRLHAKGSSDMKGGLVVLVESLLHVLNYIQEDPSIAVRVILTPDEEQMHLENFPQLKILLQDANLCLIYESDSRVIEKLSSSNLKILKNKSLVVSRKGFIGLKLTAKAEGGHSGVITKEANRHSANHEILNLATKIINSADYNKNTTTNIGILEGGIAINALAQNAKLYADARVENTEEYERLKKLYTREILEYIQDQKVNVDIKILNDIPPLPYKKELKNLFNMLLESKLGKLFALSEEHRGGGSDGNRFHYYNHNLLIIDGLGPLGSGEHTDKELIHLDSILPSISFSKSLIDSIIYSTKPKQYEKINKSENT